MPYPPLDGGAQAIYFTTKGLADNDIELKTIAINTPKHWVDVSEIPKSFIQSCRFETVVVDTRIKKKDAFLNLFRNDSYILERFVSIDFEQKLIKELIQTDYDIVQLEYLFLCKYISAIRKYSKAKIILRPQNVEYVIWERYLKGIKNPLKRIYLKTAIKRLKRFEQSVIKTIDGIIAISKQDGELFQSFNLESVPITSIPMGYEIVGLRSPKKQDAFETLDAYHLASMDWLPNKEAVDWLLNHVYPLLKNKLVTNKIYLAGRNMPAKFFKYGNHELVIDGEINSPIEFQMDKSIMLVPLLSGSGIRAKIIEAMALGKAIISTSIGAQGINYTNNENIVIADSPDDFAKAILHLMNDREYCGYLGDNAYKLCQSEYDYLHVAKKMISFYKDLLNA